MSTSSPHNDLIERYILGRLSDSEVRSFESRLGDDREFARKFRLISTFPEMMSVQGRIDLEKKLAEQAVPVEQKKAADSRKLKRIIIGGLIVFVVASVTCVFVLTIGKNGDPVPQANASPSKSVRPDLKSSPPLKKTAPAAQPVVAKPDTSGKSSPQPVSVTTTTSASPSPASGKAFELVQPAPASSFAKGETIVFNWRQKTDTFTRFYILARSTNEVVIWRGVRLGVRKIKIPAGYLYPGNYYWYVGRKEEGHTFSITGPVK